MYTTMTLFFQRGSVKTDLQQVSADLAHEMRALQRLMKQGNAPKWR